MKPLPWMRRARRAGAPRRELPVWLLAAGLLAVLAVWQMTSRADYRLILGTVAGGLGTTMAVTVVAFGFALVLGFGLGLMRVSTHRVLREIATFYVEIVRGIPMLVILYYIAFVGSPAIVEAANWLIAPLVHQGLCQPLSIRDFGFTQQAVLALALGYASFIAEVFRAGFESVPHGQMEAAFSLGMSRSQAMVHIVLPQAFRNVLPALGNDFVSMIKDSSLVSALGVMDLTGVGKVLSTANFQYLETYNVVAFLYLTLTVTLSLLIRIGEDRLKRHQKKLAQLH